MPKKGRQEEMSSPMEKPEESLVQRHDLDHLKNELHEVRKRLEKIAEMGEEGIVVYDENFRIEFANSMASVITGYVHEQLMGMEFKKLLSGRDQKLLDQLNIQMGGRDGGRVCMEMNVMCADGREKPAEICISVASEEERERTYVYMADITQRKRFERELKESEARYRNLFGKLPVGAFVSTTEGKFLDCNQALLDMLGYARKEEFLRLDIARDVYWNAADRDVFRALIGEKGYVKDFEVDFKRKDGDKITILLTGFVRTDEAGKVIGYEGLNIDISQRKNIERELREANEFLTSLIESSVDGIIATDMKGNILIFNSGAERLFGYKAEDVIGKMNIQEVYAPRMAKVIMEKMRGPDYGGAGKLQSFRMLHKNKCGELIEGNLSAAIIYDEKGKEMASVGIFTDLREQQLVQRELHDTQLRLSDAEKLAALGRVTAQIAHELNNPIYGIMNTLELLKRDVSMQSPRRRFLDMSLEETKRITELLRKMLNFSKPDKEEKRPTDVNTMLQELAIFLARQLRDHNITVEMELNSELPEIMASPNQLRQVFLNLILNARRAMPYGGMLRLVTTRNGESVVVNVEDTGVGIPDDIKGRIFEAFFTTQSKVKGVGLGLSVCYGIVKDHKGEINVESEVGKGSKFSVILPIRGG
jgi:two-component system NtrC family sensor kinase